MCEWRVDDPNRNTRVKVVDCKQCDCHDSSNWNQHNYYHGVCTNCGKVK